MAAPTIVSYAESDVTSTTTWQNITRTPSAITTTASVSWSAGDFIVILCGAENASTGLLFQTPTATGLTFTKTAVGTTGAHCGAMYATATAGSGGSSQISIIHDANVNNFCGYAIWVFSGHGGIGNTVAVSDFSSTKVRSLTATLHSTVVWAVFDWAAATPVSITPSPSHTRESAGHVTGANYTVYVADLEDVAAGAANYGVGGSGSGPFAIVAVEILGASAREVSAGINLGENWPSTGAISSGTGSDI